MVAMVMGEKISVMKILCILESVVDGTSVRPCRTAPRHTKQRQKPPFLAAYLQVLRFYL